VSPAATIDADAAKRLVLDAADALFYERGIAGVAMADVRDASGVSLRRLYSLYPSKRDLVAGWLDDRHHRWMKWFTETVEQLATTGVDPLLACFDAVAQWAASPGYRGCAFLNSIAEPTEIDDSHRTIVANHKQDLVGFLATCAEQEHPGSPPWLPGAVGALIDGAIVQSTVFGSTAPITDARCAAARLLESLQ